MKHVPVSGWCGALTFHLAEWIQHRIQDGLLRHDDPHFMAELLLSMIAGQDFEKQRFHTPIVPTPHSGAGGPNFPWTVSCARSLRPRRSAYRIQTNTGVSPDDRPTPHPRPDVRCRRCVDRLQEAGTTDAPPPEVGVIETKADTLPLQRELVGRLSPYRSADVRARVPGVLLKRVYQKAVTSSRASAVRSTRRRCRHR